MKRQLSLRQYLFIAVGISIFIFMLNSFPILTGKVLFFFISIIILSLIITFILFLIYTKKIPIKTVLIALYFLLSLLGLKQDLRFEWVSFHSRRVPYFEFCFVSHLYYLLCPLFFHFAFFEFEEEFFLTSYLFFITFLWLLILPLLNLWFGISMPILTFRYIPLIGVLLLLFWFFTNEPIFELFHPCTLFSCCIASLSSNNFFFEYYNNPRNILGLLIASGGIYLGLVGFFLSKTGKKAILNSLGLIFNGITFIFYFRLIFILTN